ncbi:alpha/beta hydrolase family protein [Halopseudomonas yangmingensis]|uniref:Triacylglycerol lipase n=1 Tax=Halopseudomonas yangmingensis TaxID=1720063 RepID=A0A1I4Q7B4_9GAMM|nr:dienelactone hydrolase family protein [Halopseudomonas yangmingensis]SFM35944.1 triacylglycerol lipase [Halopseudomonas yangmingensis]
MKHNMHKLALSLLATGALMFSSAALASNPAPDTGSGDGSSSQYQIGPDPTVSFLEASSGPFSVRTSNVSSLVSGFGGGTIHYPTGVNRPMAAIVVIPGFVSAESSIDWWGPKLASYGFVVMTIGTNSGFDQPPSRARQINNALDYLVAQNTNSRSPVNGMIDTNRLGAMGWSMGGGGTLRVAEEGRIKAAIPLAPWDTTSFRSNRTPTLIFACGSDSIAPVRTHASPFYNQIPTSTPKIFIEINRGNHYCANGGNSNNATLGRLGVAWMKRFLDEDRRYSQFLCGPRHTSDRNISESRDTCNF